MIKLIKRKLQKSLRKRGLIGTVTFSVRSTLRHIGELSPGMRRKRQRIRDAEHAFDKTYNVDTSGVIPLSELNIDGIGWQSGNAYQAVWPSEFHDAMRFAGVVANDLTFIDFGCGKGRAILLAAEYPFAKIVGVELSSELAQVAEKNIQSYRNPRQLCFNLNVVNEDATELTLPDEPLVIFLYNPFECELMEVFIQNVELSIAHSPRNITIIYLNPQHDELWKAVPNLAHVGRNSNVSVYNYKPDELADDEP